MPAIYIDHEVFAKLQEHARPFVDNPNGVLRRLLHIEDQHVLTSQTKNLEITVKDYAIRYGVIKVARNIRSFFPGFRVPFLLETDAGTYKVKVSSGHKGAPKGALDIGEAITGGLKTLYNQVPPIKAGDVLRLEELERGKRYKLTVLRK